MSRPSTAQKLQQEQEPGPSSSKSCHGDSKDVIPDDKKPSCEIKSRLQRRCLLFLTKAFINLHMKLPNPESAFKNLSVGMKLGNLLEHTHKILRREASGKSVTQNQDLSINYGGINVISSEEAKEIVKAAAAEQGLEYKDKETWYERAGPYLDNMCGFSMRWTELRIGHVSMPMDKPKESLCLALYGLKENHNGLLEGCTFQPGKRYSMAQSLGPITALLSYVTADEKLADKWKPSCLRAFSYIPHIENVLQNIRGRGRLELEPIIQTLADICRIATPRQATKVFLPFNFLAAALWSGEEGTILKDWQKTFRLSEKLTFVSGHCASDYIEFSSSGAYVVYNAAVRREWNMSSQMSSAVLGQLVFHCVFGSYKEDLSILELITDFKTRWYEMKECGGDLFKTPKTETRIHPISVTLVPKLIGDDYMKLCSSAKLNVSSAFSGFLRYVFKDPFFENMELLYCSMTCGSNISYVTNMLMEIREKLITDLQKNKKHTIGITQWCDFATTTVYRYGLSTNVVLPTSGRFFLGN